MTKGRYLFCFLRKFAIALSLLHGNFAGDKLRDSDQGSLQVIHISAWHIHKPQAIHQTDPLSCFNVGLYEGESNENLKYFLSRNLLNKKGTQ